MQRNTIDSQCENHGVSIEMTILRELLEWTKDAARFLRISRPGVRVPSIAPENAVKSKDFMAFLLFWQSLHTFVHLLHTLQKSHVIFEVPPPHPPQKKLDKNKN